MDCFVYGEPEIEYLKRRDKKLAEAIERIGPIEREMRSDLFSSLISSIVAQQISSKAADTVWDRMVGALGDITPESICACTVEEIQKFGTSFRKAGYIKSTAERAATGELDVASLSGKSDEEVIRELSALNGIGVWTAEMLLIFSLCRPDVLSYGDLAIHRGMKILYRHKTDKSGKIDKKFFERYRKRYSPHCSVASLYLWAIAGGKGGYGE